MMRSKVELKLNDGVIPVKCGNRKNRSKGITITSAIPLLLPLAPRFDGDDSTPDNWILFPAKKPGRSVADDECNPVRFPRIRTLALFFFSRTRVSRSLSSRFPTFSPLPVDSVFFPSLYRSVSFAFFCVPPGSFPIARRVEFPRFVLLYVAAKEREKERYVCGMKNKEEQREKVKEKKNERGDGRTNGRVSSA